MMISGTSLSIDTQHPCAVGPGSGARVVSGCRGPPDHLYMYTEAPSIPPPSSPDAWLCVGERGGESVADTIAEKAATSTAVAPTQLGGSVSPRARHGVIHAHMHSSPVK